MSVQCMSWVIGKSKEKGSNLLCLLMIANHAHADGTGAYPSVTTLGRECRMSERQVTRIIRNLEESGAITIERRAGPRGVHLMTVVMDDSVALESETTKKMKPVDLPTPDKMSGDNMSGPDKMSGDKLTQAPDIAVSPKPSLRTVPKKRTVAARPEHFRFVEILGEEVPGYQQELKRTGFKNKQAAIAARLWKQEYREDDVRGCLRYCISQAWRDELPDLATVEAKLPKWCAAGRPKPGQSRTVPTQQPTKTFVPYDQRDDWSA